MSHLIALLLMLPPALILVAALVLPAAEASALVGLVVPGETAVFVAGLTAHGGRLSLWAVMLVATIGAIAGDQVGFALGRRWGPAMIDRLPKRLRGSHRLERAQRLVRERGGWAVLLGRWTALLRALVPGLAGSSGMDARTFTVCNAVGGATWAATVAALGYGAGTAYSQVLHRMDQTSALALVSVALVIAVVLSIRRLRRGRRERAAVREHASAR